MKKKQDSSQSPPEAESQEAKNFQEFAKKVLSVSKEEIDRREAEQKKAKAN
ncbi:MAG: hypothetical protein KF836_08170 [Fimbriimonadaceae bacterium]|nr:hypothetical protein [Fimbriimonadaceae bacterium]